MQRLSNEINPVEKLLSSLAELRNALKEVYLIALDRPEEHALAQYFEDIVTDLQAEMEVAQNIAHRLQDTTSLQVFHHLLGECQRRIDKFDFMIQTSLCSFEQMDQLEQLQQSTNNAWIGWAQTLKQTLTRIAAPLYQVRQTILECWINTSSVQLEFWKTLKIQENLRSHKAETSIDKP